MLCIWPNCLKIIDLKNSVAMLNPVKSQMNLNGYKTNAATVP